MVNQVNLGRRAMRLAFCATVAGVALASQTAHAVVVTVSTPIVVPYNIDGIYLNVVTGMTGLTASAAPGYDINPYFSGAGTATAGFRFFIPSTGGMVGASGVATPLIAGATIGASSTFISSVVNANAATPGTNYFGFSFVNESTTLTNYGYVLVQQTANPATAGSVTLLRYAYENSGASITISAVPEPSSALLLAGGLFAFGAFGKRMVSRAKEAA